MTRAPVKNRVTASLLVLIALSLAAGALLGVYGADEPSAAKPPIAAMENATEENITWNRSLPVCESKVLGIMREFRGPFQAWLDTGDGLVPLLGVSLKNLVTYIEIYMGQREDELHATDGVLLLLPCDVNKTLQEIPARVVAECNSSLGRVVVVYSEHQAELPIPLEGRVAVTLATVYEDLGISAVYQLDFENLARVVLAGAPVVNCSAVDGVSTRPGEG